MADTHSVAPGAPDDAEIEMMARNRITRVAAYQYHVDGYRYSNLADAIAQVTRESRKRVSP